MDGVDADNPAKTNSRTSLPLDKLSAFVTPATLAVTGILYLAGWTERHRTLRAFGVMNNAFEEPIQTTLARGFPPLLVALFFLVPLLAIVWVVHVRLSPKRVDAEAVNALRFKLSSAARFLRWTTTVTMALTTLAVGYVAGAISADRRVSEFRCIVETHHCVQDCFIFSNGKAHILGIVLMQDPKRTAILTADGVALLATEQIVGVVRVEGPPRNRPAGCGYSGIEILFAEHS